MRKYLTAYLSQIEDLLKRNIPLDYDELIRNHLQKIQFMQHERLVHFLVTMLFALGMFLTMSAFLIAENVMLLPLLCLILLLLVPYIIHYYFLENAVQRMYRIYDELNHRRLERNRLMREAAERDAIVKSVPPASVSGSRTQKLSHQQEKSTASEAATQQQAVPSAHPEQPKAAPHYPQKPPAAQPERTPASSSAKINPNEWSALASGKTDVESAPLP